MCNQKVHRCHRVLDRRLQYHQSGPIGLTWVDRVPIGTNTGVMKVVTAEVADGKLRLSPHPAADPDAALDLDGRTFIEIATGKVTVDDALATGELRPVGPRASLDSLFAVFGAEPRRSPVKIDAG